MDMTFTEADAKKLAELQAKQKQAKQDERNKQKRDDRTCKALFGMTVKEVKEKIDGTSKTPEKNWWNEYYDLKCKVERLMACMDKTYDDFDGYLEWREQKKQEQN